MTSEKVELGSACTEEDRIALEKIAKELSSNKGRSKCKVANAHAMYQHGDHWKCSWCGHIIKIPLRDVIGDLTMTQHGKGGARFSTGGTASVVATGTRLSRLELAVAKLEEKVKTLEMTVKDIRWGQKEEAENPLIEEERLQARINEDEWFLNGKSEEKVK